jgi:hypothetical protein
MKPEHENKLEKKLSQSMFELLHALVETWSKKDHDTKCDCCEIPETACPPRCAGTVSWKLARGAVPETTIELRNMGTSTREYKLEATALVGIEPGSALLSVIPAAATLAPNQSTMVHVKLVDSASMRACQSYRAEVSIQGAWERCVAFEIDVQRDPFDAMEIEQSDSLTEKALHSPASKVALHWEIDRGVSPSAKVTLRNTGKTTSTFNVDATTLVGVDAPSARVTVTPSSLRLGADQSSVVRLELVDTASLSPSQTYECDLVVKGFYSQRIAIVTSVLADASCPVLVELGDPPTHVRAHHWYDHFQCTEPCT